MKVVVRCAHNRVTKAEMEREIEKLFQENKDLRLSESYLKDQLNITRQQSEVRRQKMAEKDALIEELNDQITAQEEELKHSTRLAEVCAQRDNFEASYKQVTQWWGKEQARAEEYHIALIERDCQVEELEEQLKQERKEVAHLTSKLDEAHANLEAAADASSYDGELEEQLDHYKKAAIIWQEKAEAIQECREKAEAELRDVSNRFIEMYQENVDKENEAREVIADLRDELNDRNARVDELEKRIEWLQNERDAAVKGNAELIEENAELRDNLDAAINIKNEYAETIDEMRKKIVAAQSPEFTAHLAKLIIANLPSTDK